MHKSISKNAMFKAALNLFNIILPILEDYEEEPEIEPEENYRDETDDDISDVTEEYKNLVIVNEAELEEN